MPSLTQISSKQILQQSFSDSRSKDASFSTDDCVESKSVRDLANLTLPTKIQIKYKQDMPSRQYSFMEVLQISLGNK